jgi:hypothetical protein
VRIFLYIIIYCASRDTLQTDKIFNELPKYQKKTGSSWLFLNIRVNNGEADGDLFGFHTCQPFSTHDYSLLSLELLSGQIVVSTQLNTVAVEQKKM